MQILHSVLCIVNGKTTKIKSIKTAKFLADCAAIYRVNKIFCTISCFKPFINSIFTWRLAEGCRGWPLPPWIFIPGTDKVKGGLMVLFFGLVFSVASLLEIFLPTPLYIHRMSDTWSNFKIF